MAATAAREISNRRLMRRKTPRFIEPHVCQIGDLYNDQICYRTGMLPSTQRIFGLSMVILTS